MPSQPLVVVLLRAELVDGRAEQAPLHARLDLQAGIGQHELHEAREVRAVVVQAAVLLGDRAARSAVLGEQVQLAEHALAVLRHGHAVDPPERGVLDHLARLAAGLGPRAEQQIGDRRDVDAGIGCLSRRVRCGRRTAGGRVLAGGGLLGADGGVGHMRHLSTSGSREVTADGRTPTTHHQTDWSGSTTTGDHGASCPCVHPTPAPAIGRDGSGESRPRAATMDGDRKGTDARDAAALERRRSRGAEAREYARDDPVPRRRR